MAELADQGTRKGTSAALYALSENVIVIVCDVATRLRTPPKLETLLGPAPSPLTSLRLARAGGGTRVIWALRRPPDNDLVLRAFAGVLAPATLVDVPRGEHFAAPDLAAIAADLEPAARFSLVSALLGVWSSAFKLRRSPEFAGSILRMIDSLASRPVAVTIEAGIDGGQFLMKTVLPTALGDVQAIYEVSPGRIEYGARRRLLDKILRRGGRTLHFVARSGNAAAERIVIVCANGIAVRRRPAAAIVPTVAAWWRSRGKTAGGGLREFVVRVLTETSDAGRAAAHEFQTRAPLKPRRLHGQGLLPAASVEVALQGPSGLLVAGWFRDPAAFIERLDAEDENGVLHRVALHSFPGPTAEKGSPETTGFVGFAPTCRSDAPIVQPRLHVQLRSGGTHPLIPRPQATDPVERRAIALKMVPARHASDAIMRDCLAPALADLQQAAMAERRGASEEAIGERAADPSVSVVVPLYRNLEFLKAQTAAFALDPAFRSEVEVVYVLDSPEQAGDLRQLLQGLNLLYGLPFTLVVMRRNMGYAAACNAGARAARGDVLAMVNSDVIPARPGWLQPLCLRLAAGPRVGACGPKLLFEDGSIQHAGMYFARSHLGRWLNHHYFKGMPRQFAPATEARLVPAVTGACLVIRKSLYAELQGFSEDYVIGDYEDSDLCMRVHEAGYDVAYVPAAELFHLERQSIRHNEDYMRGNADRYNALLHATRWGDAMAALMADFGGKAPLRTAA